MADRNKETFTTEARRHGDNSKVNSRPTSIPETSVRKELKKIPNANGLKGKLVADWPQSDFYKTGRTGSNQEIKSAKIRVISVISGKVL